MSGRFVTIELDRPRHLRYDPNAIADLEEALGMGLGAIFTEQSMGIRVLRAMLWAGLKWEDKSLTQQRVGSLIEAYLTNGGTLQSLGETLTEAFKAAGWLMTAGEGDADPNAARG